MIRINLIPVKVTKKKTKVMNQIYVGIFVLILTLVGIGLRCNSQQNKIKDADSQIVTLKSELDKYKEVQKEVKKFEEDAKLLKMKIQVIQQLETGRNFHVKVIDQISQAIPGNVWITALSYSEPGSAKKGDNLLINGSTYEKEAIGHFISNLQERTDYFGAVNLGSLQKKGKDMRGVELFSYDLQIALKKEEPPQLEKGKEKKKK